MAARVLLIIIASMLTTSCWDEEQAQRDVKYYCTNEVDRKATLAKCRNDPGKLAATPNCVNAAEAQRQLNWDFQGTGCAKQ